HTCSASFAAPPVVHSVAARSSARLQLHPFPTRRSSDLHDAVTARRARRGRAAQGRAGHRRVPRGERPRSVARRSRAAGGETSALDRKSTRLNSSHVSISYAVFCLKKKKAIN